MKVQYLEIVTSDVDGTIAMLSQAMNAQFSDPIAALGNGQVAKLSNGGRISVRAPMHESEIPVTRTYFQTKDIEAATKSAVDAGAELAHPVMDIPGQGRFSIFFMGNNQFGLWQD